MKSLLQLLKQEDELRSAIYETLGDIGSCRASIAWAKQHPDEYGGEKHVPDFMRKWKQEIKELDKKSDDLYKSLDRIQYQIKEYIENFIMSSEDPDVIPND